MSEINSGQYAGLPMKTYQAVVGGLVKTGTGFLHTVTLSQSDAAPTAGNITIYDSLTPSGKVLFTHTQTTAVFMPVSVTLDVPFDLGMYMAFVPADVSVTLSYK